MKRLEERKDTYYVADTSVLKDKNPGNLLFLQSPACKRRYYPPNKTEYPENRDLEISLDEKFDFIRCVHNIFLISASRLLISNRTIMNCTMKYWGEQHG